MAITNDQARIYVIEQIQDALFEMSFDPEGKDDDNKELFLRLGDLARGILDLTKAEITAVDEDGNAHVKFILSHLNKD
jgi:hypothetical protein